MRSLIALGLALACPVVAQAHIHLTQPLARTDSTTGDQKDQHCGVAGQVRTNRVTNFMPGQQITVTWIEPIQHPGWFRIALQPNGDVFPIPPASNGQANVNGNLQASNMPTENRTGMTDAATGAIVLADRIPDGTLSTMVTLPTGLECTNCTLQFIQVMIDKPPYTTDALSDDIYFNCADLTISSAPAMPDAGIDMMPDAPMGNSNNPATTGGCATSTPGGGLLLLGVAFLISRRRRA